MIGQCFNDVAHDQAGIWTSPLRVNSHDAIWLVPFAGATGAAFAYDQDALRQIGTTNKSLVNRSETVSEFGSPYATFGEAGAKSLLDQVSQAQEGAMRNLNTLQKADPQQLAKFIQGEHPQTIALVLAHMNAKAAAAVLGLLPEKLRGQAVMRMAQMQQFSPEMVQKISLILSRKMLSLGEQSRRGFGGVKAVADLLNTVDARLGATILEAVEQDSPQLAVSIRNFMFTFEDFLEVPEASIRELLGQVDKKSLAMALKGASEDLKNHFFKSMSTRAVEMLKEDMDSLGPIRSREVNQAQQDSIALARKLETQGKMVLKNEADDSFVV